MFSQYYCFWIQSDYWAPPSVPSPSKRSSSSLSNLTNCWTCKLQILLLQGLHFSPSSAWIPGECWWCRALHSCLIHFLLLPSNSSHPSSLPFQSLRNPFPFSITSTTESSCFFAFCHIPPLSTLTCKPYSYEFLPWMPLDPALVFFISALTSPKAVFSNNISSFLLSKFQAVSWKFAGLKEVLYMQRCNIYSILLLWWYSQEEQGPPWWEFSANMCLASDICHRNFILKFCKADENKILWWKKVRELK